MYLFTQQHNHVMKKKYDLLTTLAIQGLTDLFLVTDQIGLRTNIEINLIWSHTWVKMAAQQKQNNTFVYTYGNTILLYAVGKRVLRQRYFRLNSV